MSAIMKRVVIYLFLTGWTVLTGEELCDIGDRVTHQDAGINITWSTLQCELFLQSLLGKQVVAAFYGFSFDCGVKGNIEIYDGTDQDKSLIIRNCSNPFGHNVSYASRRNGLTIRLMPPYKPFRLNVYSVERYPGYISNRPYVMTTPNNFHACYNIVVEENVTIAIYFKEFYVQGLSGSDCKEDYVKIHEITPSKALCGENILPTNETSDKDALTIEFTTDFVTTYTGFEAEYFACFEKIQDEGKTVEFQFPIYQLRDEMRCFLDVQLTGRRRVTINMTVYSNGGRDCKSIIRILADNEDITDSNMLECTLNETFVIGVTVSNLLRLIFTSDTPNDFVHGIYTTEHTTEKKTSPDKEMPSENSATDKQQREQSQNNTTIIIAVVATVPAVAIIVIVVILIRRRLSRTTAEKTALTNQNARMQFTEIKEEGGIYEGNEDYDVAGIKREHKSSPNESNNIYGGTYGSSPVYAVVNRTKTTTQKSQYSNNYADYLLDNVYDETKSHSVKARDENIYE